MKPIAAPYLVEDEPVDVATEAAPARNRIRLLALSIFAALLLLGGRAVQLAFAGDPLAERHAAPRTATARADIVDRNGVLLVTTVRAFTLNAEPARVRDPAATAAAIRRVFPELDQATLERKLRDSEHRSVRLHAGLTPGERERVEALRLAGLVFEPAEARTYPQGEMAAHALGFTDVDLRPLAGVERGLDAAIRAAGAEGRPVRLSLDVRLQYAVETELAAAAQRAHASGGSAILLDGRTGETLALASWPSFDPNEAGRASDDARRDRVAGDVHELGSTIKPFTIAMALDARVTNASERFDLMQPLSVDGSAITDHEPVRGMSGLREMLAHSSNIGAARLALRIGGERQRSYLDRLGLLAAAPLENGRRQAPIAPQAATRRDVAGIGFGYGFAATPAALAAAYTVFANDGARVAPTLLARGGGEVERVPVFTPATTRQVLGYLRATVVEGTGRAADIHSLEMAGKTGTAEKLGDDRAYDESRNFSSFAAVFPASSPRYVMVVALDDVGVEGTGGMVAAPAVGRIGERIAPMLDLPAR